MRREVRSQTRTVITGFPNASERRARLEILVESVMIRHGAEHQEICCARRNFAQANLPQLVSRMDALGKPDSAETAMAFLDSFVKGCDQGRSGQARGRLF